ncbi:MAG: hypothetical protein JNL08_02970 [Planctomycetes bacterium]|nr:hypothetical protein [Planctomycetota bacterium]
MKLLRHLAWPIVLLPVLAAFVWSSFAARLPETVAARHAAGEATMKWSLVELPAFDREPSHLLARALHLAVLHVPGSSFWWSAAANALLALALVFALAALARRSFALGNGGHAVALGLAGLLACSPAFGADWLYGARLGLWLVPLLLVAAMWSLQGERRFAGRALLALAVVVAAPLCHTNGLLVFVALAPSLLEAARRAGSPRGIAWTVALLLVGNLAAVGSLYYTNGLALGDRGLLGHALAAPLDTLLALLRATGTAWQDPLPGTGLDELALGGASWLLPLLLWRLGDRSDAARRQAAPWWGCLWFGLLLFVLALERHGPGLDFGSLRERSYGAFLLPLGCLGVAAARFGAGLAPLLAGALAVLAVQDWHRGIEDLRLARQAVDRQELLVSLPAAHGGTPWPNTEEWQGLCRLGWVPGVRSAFTGAAARLAAAPLEPELGGFVDGDARQLRGIVRSSLTRDNVIAVAVVAVGAADGVPAGAVLGTAVPDGRGHGRSVPWTVTLPTPLGDGARVQVYGYRLRSDSFVRLGPELVLRGGNLQAAADG